MTDTPEMVRRAAIAVAETVVEQNAVLLASHDKEGSERIEVSIARAVIAAMREPTEAMIRAGEDTSDAWMSADENKVWQVMVAAALGETP